MSKEESSGEAGPQDTTPASDAPPKDPNKDIYENRGPKKIIRVVTVMAYLFSVSFVGILLSAYYIFLWEPPNPRVIEQARAEPQVQLLVAEPYLEEADHPERKTENLLLENTSNRTYKSKPFLLSRIAHDEDDDVPANEPNEIPEDLVMSRQERLNSMLLKLKYSLMESLRETRRNRTNRLFHETTSNKTNGLFLETREKMFNSTKNSSYGETSEGNVSVEKTQIGDGASLYRKLANSSNALPVEVPLSSKSKTISDNELKETLRFDGRSADHHVMPTVGNETGISTKKIYVAGPYTVTVNESSDSRGSQDTTTRRDGDRQNQGKDEPTKREKNSRRATDDDREANPSEPRNVHAVTTSEKFKDSQTSRSPSVNNKVNCSELQANCSSNIECCTNVQTERIARDRVSIDSSRGTRFADEPRLHQPPDDSAVKPTYNAKFRRNSEGKRIREANFRRRALRVYPKA